MINHTPKSATTIFRNVAIGKKARQSSLSAWSPVKAIEYTVSDPDGAPFAFHTGDELDPWWMIDLTVAYPISAIWIYNRDDCCQERADLLQVECAATDGEWKVVHRGFSRFGGPTSGNPLVLEVGGLIDARWLRLSLPGPGPLHLYSVEIYVTAEMVALLDFKGAHQLNALAVIKYDPGLDDLTQEYRCLGSDSGYNSGNINGIRISHAGRFGNYLQQLTNAIRLAELTKLNYIQLANQSCFNIHAPVSVNGITYLPFGHDIPDSSIFIEGVFFDPTPFSPLLSPLLSFGEAEEKLNYRIAQEIIRPHILNRAICGRSTNTDNQLTIHIRSGDIFATGVVDRGYRQPPLAFYTTCITSLMSDRTIDSICLVFEDRGNPVIDALAMWLTERSITWVSQSGDLLDDLNTLLDSKYLIFGFGTFGFGVCRLSRTIDTLYYFEPEVGGSYRSLPNIERIFSVEDAMNQYIAPWRAGFPIQLGDWVNSESQRLQMIEYPSAYLNMRRLK